MQTVPTEELLARFRRAVVGEETPQFLLPLLESAILTTRQKLEHFLSETVDDAEMPEAFREKIALALETYLGTLQQATMVAKEGRQEALGAVLEELEHRVQAVRASQLEHREALAQGPTAFPYLNRLLIQYSAVQEGADSRKLRNLLEESSSFLQWLRQEILARSLSPGDAQKVFHLQQFMGALQHAVLNLGKLPDVQDDIADLAGDLAELLTQPLLEDPEHGPTDIPSVNQIFQALSTSSGTAEELNFLLSLLDQCRHSLRATLPASSPTEVMTVLGSLLRSLDKMESCLRSQTDFEDLVQAATELESAAQSLTFALQASPLNPNTYDEKLDGLPILFRSVLAPAYAFLDGQSDADTLFAAADYLESAALEVQKNASTVGGSDPNLSSIQESLDLMREAAEMLRELASNGNPKMLDFAQAACLEAAGRLREAGL